MNYTTIFLISITVLLVISVVFFITRFFYLKKINNLKVKVNNLISENKELNDDITVCMSYRERQEKNIAINKQLEKEIGLLKARNSSLEEQVKKYS